MTRYNLTASAKATQHAEGRDDLESQLAEALRAMEVESELRAQGLSRPEITRAMRLWMDEQRALRSGV